MKIEALPSYSEDDEKNLNTLLEVFGSQVSLEDLASAYCEGGRDMHVTSEILCEKMRSSGASISKSEHDLGSVASLSSAGSSDSILDGSMLFKSKQKKCVASTGTVSSMIGREYIRPSYIQNESFETLKPVKLNSNDILSDEIWPENKDFEVESDSIGRTETLNKDIEEFLFKMLGVGFSLEMNVIQDVVGQCGYNMNTCVDKLMDLSAATLEKNDDIIGITPEEIKQPTENNLTKHIDICGRSESDLNAQCGKAMGKNHDIQRDILQALFVAPEKIEHEEKKPRPFRESRRRPHGQVVVKPHEEDNVKDFTFITRRSLGSKDGKANEPSYEDLRKAVQVYCRTTNYYYKAAIEALMKKNYEKSQKLFEEGHFFMRKARETDEQSALKFLQNSDEEEEYSINVHHLDPKSTVNHVKLQLTTLAGLPYAKYLKVVVGSSIHDVEEAQRKRLVTKLLAKESIPWTEEENGKIISIRLDEINPGNLSFAKKRNC